MDLTTDSPLNPGGILRTLEGDLRDYIAFTISCLVLRFNTRLLRFSLVNSLCCEALSSRLYVALQIPPKRFRLKENASIIGILVNKYVDRVIHFVGPSLYCYHVSSVF